MDKVWYAVEIDSDDTLERKKELLEAACEPNGNEVHIATEKDGSQGLFVYVESANTDRSIESCLERLELPASYDEVDQDNPEERLAPGEWDRLVNS